VRSASNCLQHPVCGVHSSDNLGAGGAPTMGSTFFPGRSCTSRGLTGSRIGASGMPLAAALHHMAATHSRRQAHIQATLAKFRCPDVAVWPHVPGSCVSAGLFSQCAPLPVSGLIRLRCHFVDAAELFVGSERNQCAGRKACLVMAWHWWMLLLTELLNACL
jgi:hypothetical protein